MTPLKMDLEIYRGDTFEEALRIRDDDPAELYTLTGMTGKAQIRQNNGASVMAEMTVTLMDQTEVPGGFVLSLTAAQTAGLVPGSAVWDVEFANAGRTIVETPISGNVTIGADVTRV